MSARTPMLTPAPAPLNLGLIFAAFGRAIPAALAAAVVAGGITAGVLSQVDPVYEVKTQVALGSPTDTSQDPEVFASLVPLYSEMVTDSLTAEAVSAETGVAEPEILTAETTVPGVIEVSTRGESAAQATQVADSVVNNLNLRSAQLYADSVTNLQAESQRRSQAIQARIDQRTAANPEADIADLRWALEETASETSETQLQNIGIQKLSQSGSENEAVWPLPAATALAAALLVFLIVAGALTVWFLRRQSKADALWLRAIGQRHGIDTELARASTSSGLPPTAEAQAASALSRGDTVLLLGDVEIGNSFQAYDSEKVQVAEWRAPWWRKVAPAEVGLGIVVIDKGDKRASQATTAVQRLLDSGVPAFVAVRGRKRKEES